MEKPSLALIPTGYKDGKLYSVLPENGVGDFDVVRGSGATRVNKEGLIESVADNTPRLDYTGGGCPSLLLEPLSTNLVTYSEDFSDASWVKESGATFGLNTYLSPSGENNASELNLPSTLSRITYVFNSTGVHTFSVYLRSDTDGTISIKAAAGSPSVEQQVSLTSQWQRFDIPVTDGNYWQVVKTASDTLTSVYLWGAQLEALPYATSYIPTSGQIASRLEDKVTGAGDASTFNSTEGVLYFEGSALIDNGLSRIISLSDGNPNNNGIKLLYDSNVGYMFFQKYVNGVNTTNLNTTSIVKTDFNKIALRYSATEFSVFANGVNILNNADTNIIAPNTLNTLRFSIDLNTTPFFGKVKDLRVYNTALTDAELIELTTI